MNLYDRLKQKIPLTPSHYFTLSTVHTNLPSQASEEHASFKINIVFILLIIPMRYFQINTIMLQQYFI